MGIAGSPSGPKCGLCFSKLFESLCVWNGDAFIGALERRKRWYADAMSFRLLRLVSAIASS